MSDVAKNVEETKIKLKEKVKKADDQLPPGNNSNHLDLYFHNSRRMAKKQIFKEFF